MRIALGLCFFLAACDLQPPRRQEPAPKPVTEPAAPSAPTPTPAPAPTPTPPPTPAPAPTPAPPSEDGSAATPPDGKVGDCMAVGAHVTTRLIENSPPDRRPIMEQERTRTVRTLARECTRAKWSDEIRACFLAAQTDAQIEVCSKKVAPPPPSPPRPAVPETTPPPGRP